MMQTVKRWLLWIAVLSLVLVFGYTTGYLASLDESPAVSRTLPQAPLEAPQPHHAPETLDET